MPGSLILALARILPRPRYHGSPLKLSPITKVSHECDQLPQLNTARQIRTGCHHIDDKLGKVFCEGMCIRNKISAMKVRASDATTTFDNNTSRLTEFPQT
jgi:hypothetical protein